MGSVFRPGRYAAKIKRAVRAAAQPVRGHRDRGVLQLPIVVIDGSSRPKVVGERGHNEFKDGSRSRGSWDACSRPKVYVRSTRRIEVGRRWLKCHVAWFIQTRMRDKSDWQVDSWPNTVKMLYSAMFWYDEDCIYALRDAMLEHGMLEQAECLELLVF